MLPDKPKEYVLTHEIGTYECDFLGRWKLSAIFQQLTEAAGNHAAQLGSGMDELGEYNLFWVYARIKLMVYRYPGAAERIRVQTWPKSLQQRLFYIRDFHLHDEQEKLIAAATSAWLVINGKDRKLVPPRKLEKLVLPNSPDKHGLDEPLEKLVMPDGGEECYRRTVRFSDLDVLGHMNNSRYVEGICDAFDLNRYQSQEISWLQVNFDTEVRFGEELAIFKHPMEDQKGLFGIRGLNVSNDTRAFEAAVQFRPQQD